MGLDILRIPRPTRSCLGWSRCLDDPPQEALVECLSLENILPIYLQVKGRAQALQARESSTVNLVPCDASPPPWLSLIGRLDVIVARGALVVAERKIVSGKCSPLPQSDLLVTSKMVSWSDFCG